MAESLNLASSRRQALTLGLATMSGLVASVPGETAALDGSHLDPRAGHYINPVLGGDRSDPNVLKDGDDYYATFSSFLYYPGVVIWHSRNLVDWSPIGPALAKPIGSVFALDIAKHRGRYFIYIPVFIAPLGPTKGPPFKIFVIHAPDMRGPWSEPVDMHIDGFIDPGHIVGDDGKRYLFLNNGHRVRISDDGLSRVGEIQKVYDGWKYPEDWIVEGFALEGPKLLRRGDWFYMFSGEGGTAGPPTSHMVVVARSRSIHGPWENCPHNPIVRTAHRDEPWWSRGHATAVEGPADDWWLVYHGYENGFRTLGRQMLLEPMRWTADGWPKAAGGTLSQPLPKPRGAVPHDAEPRIDPIQAGLQFYAPMPGYLQRMRREGDTIVLAGQGDTPGKSSPLTMIAGDHAYEVSVEMTLERGSQGGLLLFYDEDLFCGLGLGGGKLRPYSVGKELYFPPPPDMAAQTLYLRVVNDREVASFYVSPDGRSWTKQNSFEVSGYNQNIGDGFLSLRPALFATGSGRVRFGDLRYRAR